MTLVYSYRKLLLWGATPAPITEAGKLRHVVVREQRVVGWGLVAELRAEAKLGGPSVALPAWLCYLLLILSEAGRAGMPLGFWLVRFYLDFAVWKCQSDRLVLGSRGVSCLQSGGGSLLWDFGAPGVADFRNRKVCPCPCGRSHVV